MSPSRLIKSWVSSLVYSNIFIALSGAAYTAKTALLLDGNNGSWHVNTIAFCVILFFYCFHRINKKELLTSIENLEERNNWISAHKAIYYILIPFSVIMLLIQLVYMPLRTWLVFTPVALLGAGYTFPVIPTNKGWKRLRDIYWLKTFWIAFAFSCLTTFLPVVYESSISSLYKPEVLFIFIRSLLFLFAISMPFDVRDMEFDKRKGVITLPVRLGASASIYLAISVLVFFVVLVFLDALFFCLSMRTASALFLSALVTIVLLPLAKTKRSPIVFPLLYDSAMLLQWIFLLTLISL